MVRLTILLLTAAALPVDASVVDQATGWELTESLDQCQNVAREQRTTVAACEAYIKRGASELRSAYFGRENGGYWAECIRRNPFYNRRGIDYAAVVACGQYAQDHHGSTAGAFTFSHRRYAPTR